MLDGLGGGLRQGEVDGDLGPGWPGGTEGDVELLGAGQDADVFAGIRVIGPIYGTDDFEPLRLDGEGDDPPAHPTACSDHDQFHSHLLLQDLLFVLFYRMRI